MRNAVPGGVGTTFSALGTLYGANTADLAHTHTGPSHDHTGPSHTHTGSTGSANGGNTGSSSGGDTGNSTAGTTGEPSSSRGVTDTTGVDQQDVAATNHTHSTPSHNHSAPSHEHSTPSHAHTVSADGTGATGASGTGATGSSLDATASIVQSTRSVNFIIKT